MVVDIAIDALTL
jgi:hypothetical protein